MGFFFFFPFFCVVQQLNLISMNSFQFFRKANVSFVFRSWTKQIADYSYKVTVRRSFSSTVLSIDVVRIWYTGWRTQLVVVSIVAGQEIVHKETTN